MRIRLQLILLIFLCVCFAASTAFGIQSAAQVELKDGTVYRNVSFTVNRKSGKVELRLPFETRQVSFSDIIAIRDAEWNDITLLSLGITYRQVRLPERVDPIQLLPFRSAMTGGLGYAFILNPGRNSSSSEAALTFNSSFPISRSFALRLSFSSTLTSLSTTRYFLSMMFYDWRERPSHSNFYTYFDLGIGGVTQNFNNSTATMLATTQSIGLVTMFSEVTGLDLSIKHDLVFADIPKKPAGYIYPYGKVVSLLNLRVGFVYHTL